MSKAAEVFAQIARVFAVMSMGMLIAAVAESAIDMLHGKHWNVESVKHFLYFFAVYLSLMLSAIFVSYIVW